MILLRLCFVLLLTQGIVFCGFSQDKKEISYVKYTFRVYLNKPIGQVKKLQDEYKTKQGIYAVSISEKDVSFVVVDSKITYNDVSEVARVVDCKLEKLSETIISKSDLEKLEIKIKENTSVKE
jgi:hypothetical protein